MKKIKMDLPVLILEVAVVCLSVIFLSATLSIQSEAQTSYSTIEKRIESKQMITSFNDELEEEFLIVQEKDFKVEY